MSDFNSNALTALRGDLKTKVMMRPHLTDLLEEPAGGFMTKAEAQSVRSDESQMEWLIDILHCKGDKMFYVFCDMLRISNHHAWADRLKQEAERFRTKDQKHGEKVWHRILKVTERACVSTLKQCNLLAPAKCCSSRLSG